MATGYLKTKLRPPPGRDSGLVRRVRLLERLDGAYPGGLTLVSAPAGSGKTTLLADWARSVEGPLCWYSIDERDNDPLTFMGYFAAALETAQPGAGAELLPALEAPQPPEVDGLMSSLVEEMATFDRDFIFVIDDLHLITDDSILRAVAFLIDNLPPQLSLIIATRQDPPLPLSRLRARARLTEIRLPELTFTEEEAAEFLSRSMGLVLSEWQIGRLNGRAEGWIAGLQMAAISLAGRDDPGAFIDSFAGTHRFIVDYLAEELLRRQPEEIRSFLVETSILERMCASLCNAVTGRSDSQEVLEGLERNNMLLLPLDERREWYRYHQLFSDALRAQAAREIGNHLSVLHARASRWHDDSGDRKSAIAHALASGDFELVADLVERTWPELYYGVRPMTWLDWSERIPPQVVEHRPVLRAGLAWMLLDRGELDSAEHHLAAVEDALSSPKDSRPQGEIVVSNTDEYRSLPGSTEAARAYASMIEGDPQGAIAHAEKARALLEEGDHYWHGTAALFAGLARWYLGELDSAYESIAASVYFQRKAQNRFYESFGRVILAEIRMTQGRLRDAFEEYQRTLTVGSSVEDSYSGGRQLVQDPVALYVGLGELHRLRGDLGRAEELLDRGLDLRGRAVLPATTYRLSCARARLKECRDDYAGALDELDEAERRFRPGALPDLAPIDALRARLWLRQGRLERAIEWAGERNFDSPEAVSILDEFRYLTWARVRIARATENGDELELRDTLILLDYLGASATNGGRVGGAIDALILRAVAFSKIGDPDSAVSSLQRALVLAKVEGFVQPFVDEAAVVEPLIARAIATAVDSSFARVVIEKIDAEASGGSASFDPNRLLIEPLTARELEVLTLINDGYTNQAVADRLFIALSTVKKHLNNLFGKLTVKSRTEALRRARDLGVL